MAVKKNAPVNHRHELVKLMRQAAHHRSLYDVFRDFCEASAISISNAVDIHQREEREKRYLELVKPYPKDVLDLFPKMVGHLVGAFEAEGFVDILGQTFMALELGNKATGQFFTPDALCKAMAAVVTGQDDGLKEFIAEAKAA